MDEEHRTGRRWHQGAATEAAEEENLERGEKEKVGKIRESVKNGSVEAMRIDCVKEGVISSVRYQTGQSRTGISTGVVNVVKTGLVITWGRS